MAPRNPFRPVDFSKQGEISAYEPSRPSDQLRRGVLSLFSGQADPVTRQSHVDTVEKIANLSMLPTLAEVGYSAGQAAVNPKTRKRNLKDLGIAALGVMPGLRRVPAIGRAPWAPRLEKAIRAYHGSPYDFEKFDLSKIGTGEGAQAYGRGLYFAKNEDVARYYRDKLSAGSGDKPVDTAKRILEAYNGDRKAALAEVDERLKSVNQRRQTAPETVPDVSTLEHAREILASNKHIGGRMYEVNIHAKPNEFLDWDVPLDKQHPAVSEKLRPILKPTWQYADTPTAFRNGAFGFTPEQTMENLKKAGIPGTTYLDQLSRQRVQRNADRVNPIQPGWEELDPGTRNYVVNDPGILEIVRRYGIAGLMASLGLFSQLSTNNNQAKEVQQ